MKTTTRAGRYLHAVAEGRKNGTELVKTWGLCSKARKRYARHPIESKYKPTANGGLYFLRVYMCRFCELKDSR